MVADQAQDFTLVVDLDEKSYLVKTEKGDHIIKSLRKLAKPIEKDKKGIRFFLSTYSADDFCEILEYSPMPGDRILFESVLNNSVLIKNDPESLKTILTLKDDDSYEACSSVYFPEGYDKFSFNYLFEVNCISSNPDKIEFGKKERKLINNTSLSFFFLKRIH